MRALIIIAVVVIAFIAVSLVMPFRHDRQPGAADETQQNAAAADTASIRSTQHAEGASMGKTDTVHRLGSGTHYAAKHHSPTVRTTSL